MGFSFPRLLSTDVTRSDLHIERLDPGPDAPTREASRQDARGTMDRNRSRGRSRAGLSNAEANVPGRALRVRSASGSGRMEDGGARTVRWNDRILTGAGGWLWQCDSR